MSKISFLIPPSRLSDNQIIQQIRGGNTDAFEIIYERYSNPVYNYIWTLLNFNTDEAGLVLSDVLIEAFTYIQNKEVDNLKSLLYRIAHNNAIDWIRKNETQRDSLPKEIENYSDPKDSIHKEKINTQYKKKLMESYLSRIDEKYRSVLYLVYHEEKSYDEIALIQNSNKNSIGTLAFQGKKKLEELIKNDGIEPSTFLL